MERTYKGYSIVKQSVWPMGWNITKDGRCVKTGCATIDSEKDWINMQIDIDEFGEGF